MTVAERGTRGGITARLRTGAFATAVACALAACGARVTAPWAAAVATRLRRETERLGSITLLDYLESRFEDNTHRLRILGALIIGIFMTAYVAAQLNAGAKTLSAAVGWNLGLCLLLVYAVMAWGVMQVGELLFDALQVPEGSYTLLVILVLLGFPVAVVLAWAYEITPSGVRRDIVQELRSEAYRLAESDCGCRDPADRCRRVAILPFRDMASGHDIDYFCEGLAEEIQSALCACDELEVVARAHSFGYGGKKLDIGRIRRELRVDALVEGSALRAGDTVRIMAQLIDPYTEQALWAESYERSFDSVLSLQGEMARALAQAIQVKVSPEEIRESVKLMKDLMESMAAFYTDLQTHAPTANWTFALMTEFGRRKLKVFDTLHISAANALSVAQGLRDRYKDPGIRVESITVDPQRDGSDLWPQVLGREISDKVTVNRTPPAGGTQISADVFIEGIDHQANAVQRSWLTSWTLSPA